MEKDLLPRQPGRDHGCSWERPALLETDIGAGAMVVRGPDLVQPPEHDSQAIMGLGRILLAQRSLEAGPGLRPVGGPQRGLACRDVITILLHTRKFRSG